MFKEKRRSRAYRNCFYFLLLIFSVACSTAGLRHVPERNLKPEGEPVLSFGLIADCQYSKEPGSWFMNRYYRRSAEKLKFAVKTLNSAKPGFVIHLGDLIDRDYKSFETILPIYASLRMPRYQVLGNHDFSVPDNKKLQVPSVMGMKRRYYDFSLRGWRFVVLDGNDLSFHAWPRGNPRFDESRRYYSGKGISSPEWNGAVGREQLRWLKNILAKSSRNNEKVIIFCHFPVFPAGNNHNLWNAGDVVNLIESFSCVKAYINGHDHRGGYARRKGIHYLTLPGMVETRKKTSFAIVHLYGNAMVIDGRGRCPDMALVY